jgi:hypothetical protein
VGSHVQLDPTSNPERQYYAPDSSSIVVGFTPSNLRERSRMSLESVG